MRKNLAALAIVFAIGNTGVTVGNDPLRPPGWRPVPPGAFSVAKHVASAPGSVMEPVLPKPVFEPAVETGNARFVLNVPSDAVVTFNGAETKKTGAIRSYAIDCSKGGEASKGKFVVTVRRNGVIHEYHREVTYRNGDTLNLDFMQSYSYPMAGGGYIELCETGR